MITPTTAILVGAVALVIFGPKQLPELAKSLGKAMGEFKKGINGEPDATPATQPVPVAPTVVAAQSSAAPEPPPQAPTTADGANTDVT